MRSGKMKKTAIAISHGNASAGRKRWRPTRYSAVRSRACPRLVVAMMSLAAIEPRRLDQQDGHSHCIDEKPAGIREHIFSSGIENAEHQRSKQCALQTAEPADRNDDQEQHQIKHREAWREPEQLNGEATAKRGKPRPNGKGKREQAIDIDAD